MYVYIVYMIHISKKLIPRSNFFTYMYSCFFLLFIIFIVIFHLLLLLLLPPPLLLLLLLIKSHVKGFVTHGSCGCWNWKKRGCLFDTSSHLFSYNYTFIKRSKKEKQELTYILLYAHVNIFLYVHVNMLLYTYKNNKRGKNKTKSWQSKLSFLFASAYCAYQGLI